MSQHPGKGYRKVSAHRPEPDTPIKHEPLRAAQSALDSDGSPGRVFASLGHLGIIGGMSPTPPEPSGPARWRKPVAAAAVFSLAVLAVAADVAQLSDFSTRILRALLVAVLVTGLLYLVIKVWQFYFVQKVKELRGQLADEALRVKSARATLQNCLEAIERISDRERPLFAETLEVTVGIGENDNADLIVERRVTTAKPLVTNRTMRPIVPVHSEQIASLESICLTAHRNDGKITLIPLREQINKLKIWLVFDPPISSRSEWRVEYHPKGLWRPFRERGFDSLGWDDRLQSPNGRPSAFTSFTVTFRFPAGDEKPTLKERNEYGQLMACSQNADRTWEITWRDDEPAGRRYDWDFAQSQQNAQNQ
ncbi:hypothetical protein FB565_007593 [Actinoplanes lutulentus]|nr:hypothetical protein [Actinoplanes lutulentus]MBB2947822.1 hypothetical protein [Actinoplanes lutulentus]